MTFAPYFSARSRASGKALLDVSEKSVVIRMDLTLFMVALLTYFLKDAGLRPPDGKQSLNYGTDKVRVLQPVLIGDGIRLRDRMTLIDVIDKGEGKRILKTGNVIEVEGMDEPALYAEYLSYWFTKTAAA